MRSSSRDYTHLVRNGHSPFPWWPSPLVGQRASCAGPLSPVVGDPVGPATIGQMTRPLFEGMDMVLSVPVRWSAGFMLNLNGLYGLGPRSFGHTGRGGSIAFADPDFGLGFAYVTN
jgi:CubicO group peptidase (beta-lactamase class C family)